MEEVRMSCLSHRCSVSLLNKNPEPYTLNPFPVHSLLLLFAGWGLLFLGCHLLQSPNRTLREPK